MHQFKDYILVIHFFMEKIFSIRNLVHKEILHFILDLCRNLVHTLQHWELSFTQDKCFHLSIKIKYLLLNMEVGIEEKIGYRISLVRLEE